MKLSRNERENIREGMRHYYEHVAVLKENAALRKRQEWCEQRIHQLELSLQLLEFLYAVPAQRPQ